jgi:hypothetical protein
VVITSLWETGPIVAWEAMGRGAVVVSSRYIGSGLEGALEDGKNSLLFEIGDVDAAAAALATLARDPDLARRLRAGADELLQERFVVPVSVGHWDRCLRRALAQDERTDGAILVRPRRASGRLDRWFGAGFAESLREMTARTPAGADDPGGEWPHSHNSERSDSEFWRLALAVDRGLEKSGSPSGLAGLPGEAA